MWIAVLILMGIIALETVLILKQYDRIRKMEIMIVRQQGRIRTQRERIMFHEGDITNLCAGYGGSGEKKKK